MIKAAVVPYTLQFAQPAGTSRGVYHTRKSWFIVLRDGSNMGVGECAPLPNLSCDDVPEYEQLLMQLVQQAERGGVDIEQLRSYPSILFGIETALLDLQSAHHNLWDTPFTRGEAGITINGLIWMGSQDFMLQQIDAKVAKGFTCLKLKVGAIDFDQELSLVRHIRERYSERELTIRLDANGGFSVNNAYDRLVQLSEYGIHSIEQPIRAGAWDAMATLVAQSPIPIALDEELIGVNDPEQKTALLDAIKPSYIILKPSLHGGLMGSQEWIDAAAAKGVGWWITSALESNVGLSAIAQWSATLDVSLPQGLGTGMLFTNNIPSPLYMEGEELRYGMPCHWDLSAIVR